MRYIVGLFLFVAIMFMWVMGGVPASADMSQGSLNRQIDSTNFLVGYDDKFWCSATLIDKKRGIILTASHCVEPLKEQFKEPVELRPDGTWGYKWKVGYRTMLLAQTKYNSRYESAGRLYWNAELVGMDYVSDLAVVKIRPEQLKDYKFKRQVYLAEPYSVKRGDQAITVGNPQMLEAQYCLTSVRSVNTRIPVGANGDLRTIIVEGCVYPGQSGGALLNMDGRLIGVTNWGGGGLGAASPVEGVINFLKRIGLWADLPRPKRK